ncbi:MAG: hypothetical protein EAX96_10090 [Candidatus Lokiarchaeota archaeon]|nr:hypothetical protein [Candidatus Lokiarchaeota archaeon]
MKILDPSVGDGQFLMNALSFLDVILDEFRKKGIYNKNKEESKIYLLENCLFGVDIDEIAVERCKNRLIGAIHSSKNINVNVKRGNALFDFNWMTEFPVIFKQGGFDIIMGNPPYIRQEKIKELKPILSKNYVSFMGTADIYVYFIERSVQLLKPKGYFANILSNKFCRANYGTKIRRFILENTRIILYKDKFEKKVFEDISVDPCIIVLVKDKNNQNSKIFVNDSYYSRQSFLTEKTWSFINLDFIEIKKEIEKNSVSLKKYCGQPLSGIKTGFNKALVVTKEKMEDIIGENEHERELFVPFIKGKDVKKWKLEFRDNYLIFTENKDINKYKNIINHLKKHRSELEKRVDIIGTQKKWFELRPCTYYDEFKKPKIIYPDISNGANFTLDQEGYFADMTAFIIPKNDKFLLSILNSKLFEFYFNLIGVKLGEMGWRLKTLYMNQVPIKNVPDDLKKKFNKIIDIIMFLNQNMINNDYKEIFNFYENVLLNAMIFEAYFYNKFKKDNVYTNIITQIDNFLIDLDEINENILDDIIKKYQELKENSKILSDIKKIQDHEWIKTIILSLR